MPDYKETIPERYRARYDKEKDCFYILDTWHPQITNISDMSQDIPDNSPAIRTISASEMNSVIGLMKKMGWMDKYNNIIKAAPKSNIINNTRNEKRNFQSKKQYYPKKKKDNIDYIVDKVIERLKNDDENRKKRVFFD